MVLLRARFPAAQRIHQQRKHALAAVGTLVVGGLLLLGGRAGDILGRRRLFIAGIALFTLASLLGGLATTAWALLAYRAAQGFGAAFAAPGALALIATNFGEGPARNRALGVFSGVSAGGASLGLILGGLLTSWASWRWVMFINVPIGIAVVALAPLFIQESVRHPGHFDLIGAFTSSLGMVSLVYGFIRAASNGWDDVTARSAFGLAAILLVLFVAIEMRVRQPIVPLRLFANRNRAAWLGSHKSRPPVATYPTCLARWCCSALAPGAALCRWP